MCRARQEPERNNNLFTHTEYYGEVNIAVQMNIDLKWTRLEAWQNFFPGNPEI